MTIMATKAVPVVAVVITIIAAILSVDSAAVQSEDCPAGDVPKCEINTNLRTQIEKYPHPNSCEWYFLCSNGVAHCIKCAEGLYYDPGTEKCVEEAPAGCKEPPTDPPPTTEPPPTEPPTTEPPPTEPPPTTQPPPTEPPTTEPAPTEPPTTEPPTTEPPECPGGTDPGPPECPVCLCDGETFKHPYDCEWYYECENNAPVLKHCEGGFHWNEKLKICDYPCLAGCDNSATPEPTHSPAITEGPSPTEGPPARPNVCPAAPLPDCPAHDPAMAVFFPHPTSCSYYFECSNDIANCMPCPVGLYFNTNINDCDYPEDSGCTAGP